MDKNISSFASHGKLSEGCVRRIFFFFKEEKQGELSLSIQEVWVARPALGNPSTMYYAAPVLSLCGSKCASGFSLREEPLSLLGPLHCPPRSISVGSSQGLHKPFPTDQCSVPAPGPPKCPQVLGTSLPLGEWFPWSPSSTWGSEPCGACCLLRPWPSGSWCRGLEEWVVCDIPAQGEGSNTSPDKFLFPGCWSEKALALPPPSSWIPTGSRFVGLGGSWSSQ